MHTADGNNIVQVEDQAAFERLLEDFQAIEYVALDTEFMRTNTFYALLGLLQVADGQACYLIDPLPIQNTQPLTDFLIQSRQPGHA